MTRPRGTALIGVLLALAALLFALPSLYVPGLALLVLGPGAAAWVRLAARGARVGAVEGPRRVEEGESFAVAVAVRPGRWPLPGGTLFLPGLGRRLSPPLRGGFELRAQARVDRRGRRPLGPARLEVRDPLGLASRSVEGSAGELLVMPRVEPVSFNSGRGVEARGAEGGTGAAPEIEPDVLRPPRSGTSATRIHWPTVARTGVLMERRLLPDSGSRPMVVLDSSRPDSEEALDRAVRAVASLCVALAAGGGCLVLLAGERRPTFVGPELRAWPALHARLALVEATVQRPRLRAPERASTLFWVTARGDAPPVPGRGGALERFLVTAATQHSERSGFRVAGCVGRRLTRAEAQAA